MKKIILYSSLLVVTALSTSLFGNESHDKKPFYTAFSSGYVFKYNYAFKDTYGQGMTNIITADGCYFPWDVWGIGIKASYWRAKGQTAFLEQPALAQEVPITVYLRTIKTFDCNVQLYGSLGGGYTWVKDKSYLGTVTLNRGIGEVEVGLNYPIWRCINITGAFRYLFPPQSASDQKVNVGGCDLRGGIGFSF